MSNIEKILRVVSRSKISISKSFLGDYYVAKTGIHLRDGHGRKILIHGFSCQKNKKTAQKNAMYEVMERSLCMNRLLRLEHSNGQIQMNSAKTDSTIKHVSLDQVALSSQLDAVGLSFHNSLSNAKKHSIFELIERWLLALIWYKSKAIIPVYRESLNPFFFLDCFTIQLKTPVPFVMAIIHSNDGRYFTLGASLSESMEESIEKAKQEAIMLMHDVVNNTEVQNIQNRYTRQRYLTQKDKGINIKRLSFLKKISAPVRDGGSVLCTNICLEEILKNLNLDLDRFHYCVLSKSEKYVAIRSVCCDIDSLQRYRSVYKNNRSSNKFQLDPVV